MVSLKENNTIQKFIASLLLLVLLIGQAPKSFFHEAIATHQDEITCLDHSTSTTCVHPQPFHCGFDKLVVTIPFLTAEAKTVIPFQNSYVLHNSSYHSSYFFQYSFPTKGRAPPVA